MRMTTTAFPFAEHNLAVPEQVTITMFFFYHCIQHPAIQRRFYDFFPMKYDTPKEMDFGMGIGPKSAPSNRTGNRAALVQDLKATVFRNYGVRTRRKGFYESRHRRGRKVYSAGSAAGLPWNVQKWHEFEPRSRSTRKHPWAIPYELGCEARQQCQKAT